ncbi:MAG TPA: D-alanyl-D-alanine carboxypeptidase/D-alanyl-D-alanine-endopeptidase [Terriglobales bacterium]|nr:D-alanyl-D-alanine carboxypeptidase/D-alanyl-D-alanine-endopeptidase [Terriglobales bacterium]
MGRKPAYFATLFCLFLLTQAQAATHTPMGKSIESLLSQPDLARGFWGIEVVSLRSGKTLYALNADKLFTPASNTKLFTTAAALALIGPQYTFQTTVETSGTLDKHGRLTGDLVLVGRGDPNLSGRELPYSLHTERNDHPMQVLEQLADALVQKGVKYIDGDIVADDSYFAFERYGEGWSQDDLVWADGAPVSALTINDNVIFVNVLPADRPGDRAFVSTSPFADYYHIDNRIITTPAGTTRDIHINREPGSTVLTLWGNMPLDDAGANEALAIEDPAEFAAALFRQLLEKRGIAVYGQRRARHAELASLPTVAVTAIAPSRGGDEPARVMQPKPLVLASYQSKPLVEDLRVINKVSQNLHAEILLRLLGREKGSAGTVEGGLEVLAGFLNKVGIPRDEYVFYDGSGLSRQNLVTPDAVIRLLRYANLQPWAKRFRETLPLAGVDGSLAGRFKNPAEQGRVYAKTGSLGGVKTLSGYAVTDRGEQIAFSILSNNSNVSTKRVTDTIDGIVEDILADGDRKP